MSERKDPGGLWRQISVVVRADILLKVTEMELDISNECNQALAHLVGIDYQQQQINQTPPKQQAPVLHPVINAEDPTAISKVMKTKRQQAVKPIPEIPVAAEIPHRERVSLIRLYMEGLLQEKEKLVHQKREEKMMP